jgi:hypothetical protein
LELLSLKQFWGGACEQGIEGTLTVKVSGEEDAERVKAFGLAIKKLLSTEDPEVYFPLLFVHTALARGQRPGGKPLKKRPPAIQTNRTSLDHFESRCRGSNSVFQRLAIPPTISSDSLRSAMRSEHINKIGNRAR